MQKTKFFLPVVRTITSLAPAKRLPFSPLPLNSYYEPNPRDVVYSNNRAIEGLIKSGHLNSAQNLFDEMPVRDVISYNLIISGHAKHGIHKQGLDIYHELVADGIDENPSTFSSVLSTCSQAGFFREGIQVHCRVVKRGLNCNLFIGSSLVGLYLQMGFHDLGMSLFNELPERNLATWNLVLRGFCESGQLDELLGQYHEMKLDGVEGNGVSFCYLIRGCSSKRVLEEGKQLHCHVIKVGLADSNVFVANALVDFYSACGNLIDARNSFCCIRSEDVISWNSIVSVYTHNGLVSDALELFYMMQLLGKRPSVRSFVGFLNLCSDIGDIIFGKQIHCCVLKVGFDHGCFHVQSALIDMYGKCHDIGSSVCAYESVPEKTLECCNPLMTSLLHCGFVDDVLEIFGFMVDEGIGVDEVTFSTALKALPDSAFASMTSCRLVHCSAIKTGLESDIAVSCSLIDAYARSGHVQFSEQIFEQLSSPNVFCFTSIINVFARNGLGRQCLEMLEAMLEMDLKPDKVSFLCVLTGCSHSGLVEEGRLIFNSMKSLHCITPGREHFSCMVDLLGRAGFLDEAEELLHQAPGKLDCVMWSSLLQSCRLHRNELVGRRAAKVLLEIDPEDFAVYLQVANFFSEIGEFDASMEVREVGMGRKMIREIGHSLVEVKEY